MARGKEAGLKQSILIIGGARSGKSRFALRLAQKLGGPVLFVATATPGDQEMAQRIEQHQKERPSIWRTLETTTHIGSQIEQKIGNAQVVVVDCITLLVGNIFGKYNGQVLKQIKESSLEQELIAELGELTECMEKVSATFIIVSNEVGCGLVPTSRVGRFYRDLLGRANQILAGHADEVYLMVAGLPTKIIPSKISETGGNFIS
jgi:adenosylcobinamide kinase/adenosylcobinamide-phosphate guanylyltransferase